MNEQELRAVLGALIRSHREALPMTQEAFADSIRMHRAYYSSIERGKKTPTVTTLKRVADGLGIRVSELLKDAGI
jgi:transcriptional regulator with XRE-family HTH domain